MGAAGTSCAYKSGDNWAQASMVTAMIVKSTVKRRWAAIIWGKGKNKDKDMIRLLEFVSMRKSSAASSRSYRIWLCKIDFELGCGKHGIVTSS
jgi:hypothetical protein